MDPALAEMSVAEMDYKGAFSMGKISEVIKTMSSVNNELSLIHCLMLCRSNVVWQSAVES